MIEAKYFRDYRHSYMILQCREEEADRTYQYKILTSEKIEEILKCSLRYVNGTTYFYYDISSRTTLESMYRGRKMTFGQVKDLLQQLYGIYGKLGAYFMEESRLVLLPEYIYYDLTEQRYIGLYYPDYEAEVVNPYEPLMDYLLEHIDGKDEKLAECMYRIYEMSEETYFSLEDAIQVMGEREQDREADIVMSGSSDVCAAAVEADMVMQEEEDLRYLCESREENASPNGKRKLFYPVLAAGSVLGIGGAMGIYYFYELSQEEVLKLSGCVALMGLCLLISLYSCFKDKGKNRGRQKTEEAKAEDLTEDYWSGTETVPLEQVLNKDMNLSMAEPPRPIRLKETAVQAAAAFPAAGDAEGNTVFYDCNKMAENKLYALDRKNKKHIELVKFPYTVGKMAGCVDCVLMDDSISRIHARFEKTGDSIQMTDMNSTNGTYRNGLRMQPQETVEIEPGDEIRFGNLNYCYR